MWCLKSTLALILHLRDSALPCPGCCLCPGPPPGRASEDHGAPAQDNKPWQPLSSVLCALLTAPGTHSPSPSFSLISWIGGFQPLLVSACRHRTFPAIPCLFASASRGNSPGHLPMPSTRLRGVPHIVGNPAIRKGGVGTPAQSSRCCPDLHSAAIRCHPPLCSGRRRLWRYFLLQYL